MKRLLFSLVAAVLFVPSFALASEQSLPNGIARVGGNSTGALDYSSVNVAVVDTGISLTNPDLNVVGGVDCTAPAQLLSMAYDFHVEAYQSDDLAPFTNPNAMGYEDGYGHGTHVSGIIARMYGDEPLTRLLGVEDVRDILLDHAEKQTSDFRDKDYYHEPIAQVIGG